MENNDVGTHKKITNFFSSMRVFKDSFKKLKISLRVAYITEKRVCLFQFIVNITYTGGVMGF